MIEISVHVIRVERGPWRTWWMLSGYRVMKGKPRESLAFLRRRWERTHGERITKIDRYDEVCSHTEAERIVAAIRKLR